jgi:hypothetical protein
MLLPLSLQFIEDKKRFDVWRELDLNEAPSPIASGGWPSVTFRRRCGPDAFLPKSYGRDSSSEE